jgi:hypothetical protein
VRLLTEAYARDDLEQGEFERRIERAEQATTIEELEELVADFPAHVVASAATAATARGVRLTGADLEREVARLAGLAAPTRFNVLGDQQIAVDAEDPAVVRSVSLLGDCTVDLRGLSGATGVFLVKVGSILGDTRIVVPRGTPVEFRLINVLGDQTIIKAGGGKWRKLMKKLGGAEPREESIPPPGPTVVVTGFKLLGDTEIVEE